MREPFGTRAPYVAFEIIDRKVNEKEIANTASVRCQTGIIRTRFSAADFLLNRVIRLANTVKY